MLDILVFTDATAAESLSGSPGFQFVARSAGATRTDETLVQQRLQHSVPATLPADRWEQHPPTCAYVRVDGRMYLSRGQSTGATLGGRPGNQLTVTMMTSDAHDILPLRPAQLYASSAWDFGRPGAQDLPKWEAPLEIQEEFDIPALHELVIDDPWAAEALPHALTMLEQTQTERRVRLLLRHPDQDVVMKWVALLSRFLDAESSLGFEFRVFTDDPLRSNAHLVGVHPLLTPDLTVSSAGSLGVNFIDLERRELSPIEPSKSAKRYAKWFLSGDPYEVLEAIEVGRRWSRHMDPEVAAAAAELAAMESTRGEIGQETLRTSLAAIIALAKANETDELKAYGDELADLAASCPPTGSTDLLSIDAALWAAATAGDDELAQSLALAGLEWAAARPSLFVDWVEGAKLPPTVLQWHGEDARAHGAGLLATALNTVRGESLAAAFAFAKALNTGIAAGAITTPIMQLADQWTSDPTLTSRARAWVQAEAVVSRLAQSLDAKLTTGDDITTQALIDGSWDWLGPVPWQVDPANPASRWFALRELRTADPRRRAEVINIAQPTLPSSAWRVLLPTTGGLDPDEVIGWIKSHGDVDPDLATDVEAIFRDASRYPRWQHTGGAKVLHEIGKLGPAVPASLKAAASAQSEIMKLFIQASKDKDQVVNAALRTLGRQYAGRLNSLYADWIRKAVLESEDTRSAVALAEGHGRGAVIGDVRDFLVGELWKPTPSAMVSAVRLLNPSLGPWADAAREALDAIWDDRKTESIREQLLASVGGRLSPDEDARLDGYLEAQSKGRITRGVLRGAKSMFGNKDKRD